MHRCLLSGFIGIALLAACSSPTPVAPPQPPQSVVTPAPAPPPKPAFVAPPAPPVPVSPTTLQGYKKYVAERVAHANPAVFNDPLPGVLKSIVVLDVTIDRNGRLTRVAVQRSNHYKALETVALESVRRAAPFAAPARQIRSNDGSVNFLETFLFRDDGRFRVRSLVE